MKLNVVVPELPSFWDTLFTDRSGVVTSPHGLMVDELRGTGVTWLNSLVLSSRSAHLSARSAEVVLLIVGAGPVAPSKHAVVPP